MTQAVTGKPQPRETDCTHRERLARRLAAAAIVGLAVAGCGGGAQETQRGDTPHWHEEPERDPEAGVDGDLDGNSGMSN